MLHNFCPSGCAISGRSALPEDIPPLQEYVGYYLIPSNKGQRMIVIKAAAARASRRSALCWELCSAPT